MAKQKKTKPIAPDMVSLSELAKRAGVTRQAITSWVRKWEQRGVQLVKPKGRTGKVIDANDPFLSAYIKNTACKSNSPQSGKAAEKSNDTLRKLQWRVEKIRLENEALRNKYLPTKTVITLLEQDLKLSDEVFRDFPERVLSRIERELNCTITHEDRRAAMKMMQDTLASARVMKRRIVDDFKKKYAPKKTG